MSGTGGCYRYQLLIKHLLETPLFYAPDREIVYRDKVRMTYRSWYERVKRLAGGLTRLGVKAGDGICVLDYDSHRYLECLFAVPMMGAVLHTQNWRLPPEQVVYMINHARDRVLFVHSDFLPLWEEIRARLTTVEKIVLLTDDPKPRDSSFDIEYEEMLASAAADYEFADFDENTRATTFYTTGTTGLPKGVYFSHRQLVLHTLGGIAGLGVYNTSTPLLSCNDVYMPITPMFHVHAWGVPYMATLLGIKQVYPGRYDPEMLCRLITAERVTFSHCVPTILHMLVNAVAGKQLNLSHWKVVIGGARFPKGLAQAAIDLGIQVYAGYGMSETCPIISLANLKPGTPREKEVDKKIMTGLPVPLVYARVMDPDGNFLPHDGKSTGELALRAPWLTESYFEDPERSRDLWHGGWLHTGDVACIDPEGYIQITDRLKDVIKTGGEWISSLELENIASQHSGVAEAAAIGVSDPKWGERPLILVVARDEYKGRLDPEEIRRFIAGFAGQGQISRYAVPDRVLFVDAIPKNTIGKVDKIALRKIYGA